ncbi:MAG: hypothetical protein HQL60_06990 [Magnetococcales bacterium]|nr:hypothetical protein [Magnetococcales bacterium]
MSLALSSASISRLSAAVLFARQSAYQTDELEALQQDELDEFDQFLSDEWWDEIDDEGDEADTAPDPALFSTTVMSTDGMNSFMDLLDAVEEPTIHYGDILSGWTIARLRLRCFAEADVQNFAMILYRLRLVQASCSAAAFLATLTTEELQLLCRIQGLENCPQNQTSWSESDAIQLLNQFGPCQDKEGALCCYPPPEAPAPVFAAWQAATESMSPLATHHAMAPFLAWIGALNTRYDLNGEPVAYYQPGDSAYQNPYQQDGFSFCHQVREMLQRLELFQGALEEDLYQRQRSFLYRFYSELKQRGAS